MGLIRGLAGAVLSLAALLLAVVAVVLCVTVILLPLGLPLLAYAGRISALALRLMLPRAVSHPVRTAEKSAARSRRKTRDKLAVAAPDLKRLRKRTRAMVGGVRKRGLLGS